ncbi:MAG: thermonuclease family protein [Chloroflexi bacterium]|nr:thermonuclease family protein [Chloroflexota bacterium]
MLRRFGFLPLLLVSLLLPACVSSPATTTDTVRVIYVIDGDTIEIEGGYRVRYIGMDTPERGEAFYIEATQANRQLVAGERVRLERDVSETDRYGRLLRYVWVDDVMVNAELVKLGLAEARAYPPDTRYQGLLDRLEGEARAAEKGMWGK